MTTRPPGSTFSEAHGRRTEHLRQRPRLQLFRPRATAQLPGPLSDARVCIDDDAGWRAWFASATAAY